MKLAEAPHKKFLIFYSTCTIGKFNNIIVGSKYGIS